MSQDHKDALAKGRKEARALKAYLQAIQGARRGRPVTKESLQERLTRNDAKLDASEDALEMVELIQRRLDIESELARLESMGDLEELEAGFVEHASSYSGRKGISYTAWREAGVPAATLRSAGIKQTRRR